MVILCCFLVLGIQVQSRLRKRERDWYEIDEPKEGLDAMDNTTKSKYNCLQQIWNKFPCFQTAVYWLTQKTFTTVDLSSNISDSKSITTTAKLNAHFV